jgi:ferredoxin-nitrite reductase
MERASRRWKKPTTSLSGGRGADGHGVEPGIYFRLSLGGITGHKDFARDTGVILKPNEATEVADRIVRVFIENGDRTNRNKARLKYVLDSWGSTGFRCRRGEARPQADQVPAEAIAPRPAYDRFAHIGVHPQKQAGLNWIGVALKLGHLSPEQIRGLSKSPPISATAIFALRSGRTC